MTPKSFAALAVAAAVSTLAAAALYTSSVEWSRQTRGGIPLFAELREKASDVTVIEVEQGDKKITVKRKGEEWVLGNHDSFPASKEKVQGLLAALRRADLVEPKTRKLDRFALLGVEDPTAKDAKSNSVRLLDMQGESIAAAIIGNRRPDAFGMGRGGTYVRKSGDEQAWLANAEIEAGTGLENWVEPQLFATRSEGVKSIELTIPGEEPLKIERDPERSGHTLAEIPEGMKLKYLNIVDNIVSAATTLEFADVRKRREASANDKVSTVAMELEGGLKVDVQFREKDGASWITLTASGEGEAKKVAEDLVARAKGWEFRISESRAKEILKRRDDLLERVSS